MRPARRRLRSTVRLRLAALYAGLFVASGAGMLALTYFLFRTRSGHSITYRSLARVRTTTSTGLRHMFVARGVAVIHLHPRSSLTTPLLERHHVDPLMPAQKEVTRTVPVSVKIPGSIALQTQRVADLHHLLVVSGIALGLMAVVATVIGWLLAGRVLRPLRAMTATAQRLSSTNLHERLALDGPHDELRELADTFDGFLARLEAAFDAQRRFVHHASHEFRTPLARQRALLEVALADPSASVASLRHSCERVLATGDEQERLIDGLLTLARSEAAIEQPEPVDVRELVSSHVELRRDAIRQRHLTISTALGPAHASGNRTMLERLVANLLDNAIEHNLVGGDVSVATTTEQGRAMLRLSNSGPVLSTRDVGLLVEPLGSHRGRPTSRRGHPGLGLAIVHSVAATHRATIAIHNLDRGGLEVVVAFAQPRV